MKTRNDREAHRAFEDSVQHVGCSGECADGADCTCSHAMAWRAPRQPRAGARKPTRPGWKAIAAEAFGLLMFAGTVAAIVGLIAGLATGWNS